MNRRSFFSIVAAVVVAPATLWGMVKRPTRTVVGRVRFWGCGSADEIDEQVIREEDGTLVLTTEGATPMTPEWQLPIGWQERCRAHDVPRGLEYWMSHPSEIM